MIPLRRICLFAEKNKKTNYAASNNELYLWDSKRSEIQRNQSGNENTSMNPKSNSYINDTAAILTLSNQKNSDTINAARPKTYGKTLPDFTLKLGSRGDKVRELQTNLTDLGYNTKGIDGIFGEGTKAAVLAFQKAHGLKKDGIVGTATQNAIKSDLKKMASKQSIQKMIQNLKNNLPKDLSSLKRDSMIAAAERLLNEKYDPMFVAGVLANIQAEGEAGKFENSKYIKNPNAEPEYLKNMDNSKYKYEKNYSGKHIQDIGIKKTEKLVKYSLSTEYKNSRGEKDYSAKFGLGMLQWTGVRTAALLKSYKKYAKGDKPTNAECIQAEINFLIKELKDYNVYAIWKNGKKMQEI